MYRLSKKCYAQTYLKSISPMYLSQMTRLPFSSPTAMMFVSDDTSVHVILLVNGHTRSGLNSTSVMTKQQELQVVS